MRFTEKKMEELKMKIAKILCVLVLLLGWMPNAVAQRRSTTFTIASPDGKLKAVIHTNNRLSFQIIHDGDTLLHPSYIDMDFSAENITHNKYPKLTGTKQRNNVRNIINSPFCKQSTVVDHYNELSLFFKGMYNVSFRMYNQGLAYRFITTFKDTVIIKNETAAFGFPEHSKGYVPYVKTAEFATHEQQFHNSFENTYAYSKLSEMDTNRLAFLPLLVETKSQKKILVTEADLEDYPGMYLQNKTGQNQLTGVFAPYPKILEHGGYNKLQLLVKERESYIARCTGTRNFPWRIFAVAENDKDLLDNDMVYQLAAPSRIADVSWIKPGKVAWDWWNAWNLYGVDFKTGVNTETYKYYIDFASKAGLEYILLDEGWAVNLQYDLKQVVPEINLKELIVYADKKKVGVMLWAGYYAFEKDMEEVCKRYSEMGIKGFKIDFMDRDDQLMVDFYYRAAKTAAKYKLLIDFHGSYKPTGLQRTYPNVLNFEGIHGMEQMKWSDSKTDQVTYDVTFPFIRMVAGPVDYTQGTMRNATKDNYRAISSEAMSQGTRCRQLADYIVFYSPLAMLCDNPVNYENEWECTQFIAKIPTVWDETKVIKAKIADQVIIARRKGADWFIGGLNNWDKKIISIDLSFLGEGSFEAEIFKDGINADRAARDYKREVKQVSQSDSVKIEMASGGGLAISIKKSK